MDVLGRFGCVDILLVISQSVKILRALTHVPGADVIT